MTTPQSERCSVIHGTCCRLPLTGTILVGSVVVGTVVRAVFVVRTVLVGFLADDDAVRV